HQRHEDSESRLRHLNLLSINGLHGCLRVTETSGSQSGPSVAPGEPRVATPVPGSLPEHHDHMRAKTARGTPRRFDWPRGHEHTGFEGQTRGPTRASAGATCRLTREAEPYSPH